MGLGLGWPSWKDTQDGDGAEPATNDAGADMQGAVWMTPRFLIWVMGWTTMPLVEMGTWETEQL